MNLPSNCICYFSSFFCVFVFEGFVFELFCELFLSLGLIMTMSIDQPVEVRTINVIVSLDPIDESTLSGDSLGVVINTSNDGSNLTITIMDPSTLIDGVFTIDQVWNLLRSSLNFDQYQMVKLLYDTPFGDVPFREFERVRTE